MILPVRSNCGVSEKPGTVPAPCARLTNAKSPARARQRRLSMWKFFQLAIMAAVMCGNIYYQWTPNPYLVGLLGLGAAYIVTVLLVWLGSIFCRRSAALRYEAASHHKRTVGARWDTDNLIEGVPRTWVRNDPRNLVEVAPEAPRLERIVSKAHPLSGTRTLGGKRSQPRIGH